MSDVATGRQGQQPRTLIFSLRNIFPSDLYRCPHYEFEDTIAAIDGAEILAPHGDPTSRRNNMANNLAFHGPIWLKAQIEKMKLQRSYDIFFALIGHPRDLLMVDAVSEWRKSCTLKICMIDELWIKQMEPHRHFLEVLKGFDLIVMYYSQSVKTLQERVGVPCVFVPPGIDSILFSPLATNPPRSIDVYSVGRRSQTTHEALLRMVQQRDIFYLHDTISGTQAMNSREHRRLFANLARRSRYFLVNPGLIDRPDRRGNQMEIGNRYFEGAAAGTIMIGQSPANGEFEKLFDWPDALVPLPYGSDQIAAVIDELDRQPERQEQIRRTNMAEALSRHDWVYRWEAILRHAGREPMAALHRRKERLLSLASELTGVRVRV